MSTLFVPKFIRLPQLLLLSIVSFFPACLVSFGGIVADVQVEGMVKKEADDQERRVVIIGCSHNGFV